MAKQIVNGVEYSNEFDPQIYAKIGTSQLETQADNLSDAVNELKQSLSAKGYYTLLNGVSVSNTREAKTLHGSRKLSDYPLYLAFVRVGSGLRASMMLPKTMFQYGSDQISLFYVDASNTQRWFEITWKSDTEVYVQSSSNVANSTTIWLFGILV